LISIKFEEPLNQLYDLLGLSCFIVFYAKNVFLGETDFAVFVDRFVRFVSTPAVLERFVSLEKEIQQIEGQFQANALSMSVTIPDEGMYG
jgi:hypothetical protein